MILTADFKWPAIFAVNLKTHLYYYFYGKDKNPAIITNIISIDFATTKT